MNAAITVLLIPLFCCLCFGHPVEVEGQRNTTPGDLFEGDIILAQKHVNKRNGEPDTSKRWPGGRIPYVIYGFDSTSRQTLQRAFQYFGDNTCLRLIPKTSELDYVVFQSPMAGCSSYVGRIGGPQAINLAPDCFNKFGTVLHEIMHAIGFGHEMAREDRDQYVTIHWENIPRDLWYAFDTHAGSLTYGTTYDITSVMQYSATQFSQNGQYTITPKSGSPSDLGQRERLSATDLYKVRAMYSCGNSQTVLPSSTSAPVTSSSCMDENKSCPYWASWSPSECERNFSYMLHYCKKSCQSCGDRVGCFNRIYTGFYFAISTQKNSAYYCKRLCASRGYSYAGLSNGDRCYCGDSTFSGVVVDDVNCQLPCADGFGQTCGGHYNYEIYHTVTS